MLYPWFNNTWTKLWRSYQKGRLAHALLFTGLPGLGKKDFSHAFARALLCEQNTEEGFCCDHCHACRLTRADVHPDLFQIEPEKAGHAIKIDQIRAAIDFISQSALMGTLRLVLINEAHMMNKNAANALLKTLEEPSPNGHFFLISPMREQLPVTIVSRCQNIGLQKPNKKNAIAWLKNNLKEDTEDGVNLNLLLKLGQGAPLAALAILRDNTLQIRKKYYDLLFLLQKNQLDPIQTASKLLDIDILQIIDFTVSWLIDLLHVQWGDIEIINIDYEKELSILAPRTSIQYKQDFTHWLCDKRKEINSGINLNSQMLLESILIRSMRK